MVEDVKRSTVAALSPVAGSTALGAVAPISPVRMWFASHAIPAGAAVLSATTLTAIGALATVAAFKNEGDAVNKLGHDNG
jgi:hypothetical protein